MPGSTGPPVLLIEGQAVGLLAPLVVNRKAVYTDLTKWAKARGHTHLRVDGEFPTLDPWPRLDRFKEHTLEPPVGDIVVSADREAGLRALLAKTTELGKGVMHLLTPLYGLVAAMEAAASTAGIGQVKVFSTQRACPTCVTTYAELDSRMFSRVRPLAEPGRGPAPEAVNALADPGG